MVSSALGVMEISRAGGRGEEVKDISGSGGDSGLEVVVLVLLLIIVDIL